MYSRLALLLLLMFVLFLNPSASEERVVSAITKNSTINGTDPIDKARWNFALRVWRQSSSTSISAVTSPVISALLITIAQLGSEGETYNELMHTLRYPEIPGIEYLGANITDSQLLKSWKQEFDELLNCSGNNLYCINAVHLLKMDNNITIKESFIDSLKTLLNQKLIIEDYETFVDRISSDEYKKNTSKNHRMVGEMRFSEDSLMLKVNVSFHDHRWMNPFKPEKTISRGFGTNRESLVELSFMPGEVFTSYYFGDNEDVQILGIPFADNKTCMYMFLPLNRNGLAKFELESEGDRLLEMIRKLRVVDVEVEALKFEMESVVDLTPELNRLDIKKAVGSNANFTAITNRNIFIQNITVNTVFRIDEDGFKASKMNPTTKRPVPKVLWQGPHYRFVAYHPFFGVFNISNFFDLDSTRCVYVANFSLIFQLVKSCEKEWPNDEMTANPEGTLQVIGRSNEAMAQLETGIKEVEKIIQQSKEAYTRLIKCGKFT
uniref:SERPIN domain-containing protein n=1 Tax=Syphacia muris TaxID=451379 RepID=A0A0N5AF39_9BILA